MTRTNGREIERTLLLDESFRRTLRMYLEGAYTRDDNPTSQLIQQLAAICPRLFSVFLNLPLIRRAPDQPLEFAYTLGGSSVSAYVEIKTFRPCVPSDIIPKVKLSSVAVDHEFLRLLRAGYCDYDIVTVTDPGSFALKCFGQVSFFEM